MVDLVPVLLSYTQTVTGQGITLEGRVRLYASGVCVGEQTFGATPDALCQTPDDAIKALGQAGMTWSATPEAAALLVDINPGA